MDRDKIETDKGNTKRQIARSNYKEKECFSDISKKPQEQVFVSSYHRAANTSATLQLIKTISATVMYFISQAVLSLGSVGTHNWFYRQFSLCVL